jgi:CubicO group peptidase (beta-lactamase class C family)
MRKTFIVIALNLLIFNTFSQNLLNGNIARILNEQKMAGAVWCTIDSSRNIKTDAAGFNNIPQNILMKPTDKVLVGSITKSLLSAGILQLATEGKLDVNDPVNKFLPEVKFDNPWEKTHTVTIQHLMDNSSGLGDLRLWHIFNSTALPDTPLSAFYTKDPSVLKIYSKPGSMFSYSNMGFTLLGMVIESVTKQRFETYLDEHLIKPLGMKNSTFQYHSQTGKYEDKMLAMGNYDGGTPAPNMPLYVRPAAQFMTTAYDMGLFLKFLMSDGQINGKQFIDLKYLKSFGNPRSTIASQKGLENGYSAGMMRRDRHGVQGIYGLGNIIGYKATTYFFPNEKSGFFISFNMDSETADYELFNVAFINYLGIKTKPFITNSQPLDDDFPKNIAGYYVPVFTKYEPFDLSDKLSAFMKIEVDENLVTISPFQQKTSQLFYNGKGKFSIENRTESSHVFYKNENEIFMTYGTKTLKKYNGTIILMLWISFILGVLSMVYVLLSGVYKLFKYKKIIVQQPIIWASLGILSLLIPIPFFLTQSFVEIGDKSIASILLMLSTIVLPLGTIVSGVHFWKVTATQKLLKFDLIAVICVFQFLCLLIFWGLIPFRIWV